MRLFRCFALYSRDIRWVTNSWWKGVRDDSVEMAEREEKAARCLSSNARNEGCEGIVIRKLQNEEVS